ncbi:MAG: hypothetical protein FWG19_00355 [Methanomassiliicoccaceae archaeon]|nr:hypothetical protein [Methanomassiliicoccaceae archaeon]
MALTNDGKVYAWGYNSDGQLGIGTADNDSHSTPVQVKGVGGSGNLTDVTAIAGGEKHSLAIIDGTVWAWGGNGDRQLGDGSTFQTVVPVKVMTLSEGGGNEGGGSNLLIIAVVAVAAAAAIGAAVWFFVLRKP